MAKSATIKQTDPVQGLEFTLYVFEKPADGSRDAAKWAKHETLTSLSAAEKQAEILFNSGKFQKIEIKQKFFDKKKNRSIDTTLKIMEQEEKRAPFKLNIPLALTIAAVCGGIAFAAAYFLTR